MMSSTPLRFSDAWRMAKQSLHMAWPIAGSRVLVALSNFFAMWMIALLGHQYLAAGALIYVMQTAITVIMASILFAISPLVSRAHGAGDYDKIGAVAQQGWLVSLILMVPTLLLLWFAQPILLALGQDPALAAIANSYFHVYILAIIPMFFLTTAQMLMMGAGKQRLGFLTSGIASLALFPVAYALTLGKWGLPNLGIQGVAWGMVAGIWSSFIFSGICLLKLKYFAEFGLFRWRLRSSWSYLKQLLETGWPIVVQTGGELFSWFLVTMLIGWLGTSALGANQITNQFNILIIIPMMGFSQASSILIGQAAGAKRYDELKHLGWVNMGLTVLIMLVIAVFYLGFPKLLIGVYLDVNNPLYAQTVHFAVLLFAISTFSLLFDNVRNITIGALRGVYDNRYPMYLSLALIWFFGLPLGYFMGFHLHLGVAGLALGNMIGIMIGCLILLWRWQTRLHHLLGRAEISDQSARRNKA